MSELPRTLKIATVWLLLGALLFLGVQGWQRQQQATQFSAAGGVIEIRRGADGHYHWPGTINGVAVDFLVDTGATSTAMPARLARSLGLESVGQVRSQTAGGPVTGQVVRADVELEGGVQVRQLRVVALEGLGDRPLLGMDVLGRLHWRQAGGVLTIDLR
ncbi:MAG: retroviral-like aspartic protease family protein [Burkholderiaceae bacterium]|nr:retroviral-like aspartic protease family protein [Burkholderiaceae bacterium]